MNYIICVCCLCVIFCEVMAYRAQEIGGATLITVVALVGSVIVARLQLQVQRPEGGNG